MGRAGVALRRMGRVAGVAAVVAAVVAGLGRWLRPLSRYEVAGESMAPSLEAGDYVLAVRLPRWAGRPRVGWIVVAERPDRPGLTVIKRVASLKEASMVGGSGVEITLLGDNPKASTDSRQFGPVGAAAVWGVVWLRYWPISRISLLLQGRGETRRAEA